MRSKRFILKYSFTVFCIVALFIVVAVLAGCGSDSTSAKPDNPTEAPAPTPVREFDDELPRVQGNPDVHVTMTVDDEGYDVYAPLQGKWGYRYGPSIIYYPDGSIDAWFATPGITGEWDWFTYKHSDDGGKTWSYEKVVLQPTGDSYDHYSVCDPGVIFFNDYYYIGYTSTIVSTNGGINNNIFVARSKNPDGPYEKWNGEGWGGDPAPIIYYNESDSAWGAGEPSFVVLDGTLYMYYTWTCSDGNYTMVATANANDENWPGVLDKKGLAYTKIGAQDSCDVVYIEDIGKFVAFSTYDRFTATSGICIMESDDGINFTKSDIIRTGTLQFLHNMGISKRSNGHIQLDDELCFVGYAYSDGSSDNWGKWATRFQNVTLTYYEGKVETHDPKGKGTPHSGYFWEKPEEWTPISVGLDNRFVQLHTGTSKDLECKWYDTLLGGHAVEDLSLISFSEYDEAIVKIEGTKITALKEGRTHAKMMYGDNLYTYITIQIYNPSFDFEAPATEIVEFKPVQDSYVVYKKRVNGGLHKLQIRGFVVFNNGSWGEAYNDNTKDHPNYPAMVDGETFTMTFTVEDESIVKVSKKGIITPRAVGTTNVTVTITGGLSFTVPVTVYETLE
ncbi:MAG: hypothetical protein E7385_08205 [Ruminococcaceae bacterium]|nr:hypothetical protein [Oscillospiraceae bacterium]